jgi:hypothetical protein
VSGEQAEGQLLGPHQDPDRFSWPEVQREQAVRVRLRERIQDLLLHGNTVGTAVGTAVSTYVGTAYALP